MQYSPKLKEAMEEIKKILKNHDIAGAVVLNTPGYSEYLVRIDPTYSCAFFAGDFLRVRAKLQEDFNGDQEACQKAKADTANMLHHLSKTTGQISLNLFEVSEIVNNATGAEHLGGTETSHFGLNN